jgi:phage-related protein
VRDVKPAFDEMRLDVQESLFMGLADVVKPLANTYLPIVTAGFQGVARQASIAARDTADFLLQGAQVQKVSVFSAQLQTSFGNLAGALRPAVGALLDLVTTGSTFLPGLTEQLGNWATQFSQRISEAAKSGELAAFFQRSIDALRSLGEIAGNVFGALRNIFKSAEGEAGGFLQRIQEITQRFEAFTGSTEGQAAFGGFFESMRRVIDALGPAFFELITIIGRDFLPILADIAQIIGPVLKPLFETFGRLLQALRPLIDAIAQAFGTALEALGPFFDALGKAITEAMPVLGPLIQDIGEAFANLFEAMVPLAPLFVELLEAVLPIIPPLIQMVADLMPQFIEIIQTLMPYIKQWFELMATLIPIFTDIVGFLLDVFIPVLQFLVSIFTGILSVATTVIQGIWDLITTVFGAIADFFVGIWDDITSQVSTAWNAIGDFFSDGIAGAVGKVGQFASDIWNKIKTAMSNVVSAVSSGIGNVVDWFAGLPGRVLGALGDLVGRLFQAGKDLIQGLWNGIKAMVQKVIDAVKGLVNDAIGAAKSLLGIASPSKVFKEIGQQIGQGLTGGIVDSTGAVADAAAAMAQAAVDAASITAPSVTLSNPTAADLDAARAAGAERPVIQQTNIMRPGTDLQQFTHLVVKRAYGDVLSGASTLGVRRNPVQAGVDDQWVNL